MLIKEIGELRLQLKIVEESRGTLNREFKESQRKLSENKDLLEGSQKETSELKRLLKDAEMEKDVAWSSANDLRDLVKSTEGIFLRFCILL